MHSAIDDQTTNARHGTHQMVNCVSIAPTSGNISAWSYSRLFQNRRLGVVMHELAALIEKGVSYSSASITKNLKRDCLANARKCRNSKARRIRKPGAYRHIRVSRSALPRSWFCRACQLPRVPTYGAYMIAHPLSAGNIRQAAIQNFFHQSDCCARHDVANHVQIRLQRDLSAPKPCGQCPAL
jgi:hypothetical protein